VISGLVGSTLLIVEPANGHRLSHQYPHSIHTGYFPEVHCDSILTSPSHASGHLLNKLHAFFLSHWTLTVDPFKAHTVHPSATLLVMYVLPSLQVTTFYTISEKTVIVLYILIFTQQFGK
jgi:hypothetical protein